VGRLIVQRLADAVFGGVGGHVPRAAPPAFAFVGWFPRRRREVVVAAPRRPENARRAGHSGFMSKPQLRRCGFWSRAENAARERSIYAVGCARRQGVHARSGA